MQNFEQAKCWEAQLLTDPRSSGLVELRKEKNSQIWPCRYKISLIIEKSIYLTQISFSSQVYTFSDDYIQWKFQIKIQLIITCQATNLLIHCIKQRGNPSSVMAKVLEWGLEVSEFEFQLCYYVLYSFLN